MAFAIGHISGCHLNPAVSFGLWAGGRFPAKELLPYIIAQVLGGIVAGVAKQAFSCQRVLRLTDMGPIRLVGMALGQR